MAVTAFNAKAVQCPGCGAQIVFKVGASRVLVCEYCSHAVARTDRGLENLGKVADLVETGARLALGAEGSYSGVAFQLVGRLQYRWAQGVWDEWYASFADGRWGWVAEAQGRYYVSFKVSDRPAPAYGALVPGKAIHLSGYGRMVVADLKTAQYVAARGELPERIALDGPPVRSADLSGPDDAFATLDYANGAERPTIFLGREVPFEALKIRSDHLEGQVPLAKVKGEKIVCPKCRGPLELKAPDAAVHVTCPYCNALLDASQGALRYLAQVEPRKLTFPLGSRASFGGVTCLLIGWLERSCTVEGTAYFWEEYLLYDERTTRFRWLVSSEGHWSLVDAVQAGEVEPAINGLRYRGNIYKPFSKVDARVTAVLGEFYWAVEVGEQVLASDYIRPPQGLSVERGVEEVNYSHAVYLAPQEVWKAFGKSEPAPPPRGAGAMQPNPHEADVRPALTWMGFALAAVLILFLAIELRSENARVYQGTFPPAPAGAAAEGAEAHAATAGEPWQGVTTFSPSFEVAARRNVEISITSNVQNSWAFASGALVNEETGEFEEFNLESSHYSGQGSDGSWTENDRENRVYLSAVNPGRYFLRVETGWEPGKPQPAVQLAVTLGVARLSHFLLAMVPIVLFPALLLVRRASFEKRRWEESNFEEGGASSAGEGGGDVRNDSDDGD